METERFEWTPKTELGKEVLAGKYPTLTDVLLTGKKILEPEIVDHFLGENLEVLYADIGQAKGKFGGGSRKPIRNTQKVAEDGKKIMFSTLAIIGNRNGIVGLGYGRSRETIVAKEKALAQAKKNVIMIKRGCGDWGCFCGSHHSFPFTVEGKSGSVKIILKPAPKGTGLVAAEDIKKVLLLAGVHDVWSQSFGQTKQHFNLVVATFEALKKSAKMRLVQTSVKDRGIVEGDKNE